MVMVLDVYIWDGEEGLAHRFFVVPGVLKHKTFNRVFIQIQQALHC
jgi:hypothetical protein